MSDIASPPQLRLAAAPRPPARAPSAHVAEARDATSGRAITATILTRDSAARLRDVLAALGWCDEVIVLDTGSTDETVRLANAAGAHVKVHVLASPFPGFGAAHRMAVALARNDWILSIDSDEVLSPELMAEIAGLTLDPDTVYSMPFRNHFNGRLISSCGWSRERHARLFNRTSTNFCASAIHEKVQSGHLRNQLLAGFVDHYSYDSIDDFLRKMRAYSGLYASQNQGRKSAGPLKAVTHGAWMFLKTYLLQRGCLQGYEGLVISSAKAQGTFWKYLRLYEANLRRK